MVAFDRAFIPVANYRRTLARQEMPISAELANPSRIVVASDGKTRTVTTTGTDAAGKKFTNVAAYDKQ